MLLTGETVSQVRIRTPKGPVLDLEIEDIRRSPEAVSCAVRKDSGDDPDVTNHALIYARVGWSDEPGVRIEGGEGVGRVTKPGLDQPVGAAAINSTPRRMIREAVLEALTPREMEALLRRLAGGESPAAAVENPAFDMERFAALQE